MKAHNNINNILLCVILIAVAVCSRVVTAELHWYNFGPMVAISLFSGVMIKNRSLALLVPLVAYFASDLCLELISGNGFYGISQFFVYGGMALVVLLGGLMKQPKVLKVAGYTIGGSLIFWIVSNFGVFLSPYYPHTLSGLAETYLMALPFYSATGTELFRNQFLGDLFFSGVLFGAYALLRTFVLKKEAAIH